MLDVTHCHTAKRRRFTPGTHPHRAALSGAHGNQRPISQIRARAVHGTRPDPRSGRWVSRAQRSKTRRPDIAVDPDELRDLADSMIRVLDGEGYAVVPWTPGIDAEALRRPRGLGAMVMERTRRRRGPDKLLLPSVAVN